MPDRTDPIESADDAGRDLYDVATWEPRTLLDRTAVAGYWTLTTGTKAFVIVLAAAILLGIGALGAFADPVIRILTVLSVVPAAALAGYVRASDVTTTEPLALLVATFLLAVLTATFAAVLNSAVTSLFGPFVGISQVVFFFLVVGPVEETVKLLAVRLYAYTDVRFDAVIDGAVYGAVAGLGFATIENLLYISRNVDAVEMGISLAILGAGDGIAAVRAFAGPGHVIYSAFAGYYLGLAKFNPEHRGPIVLKGIAIAAVIHATYNSTVGIGTGLIGAVTGLGSLPSLVVYVLVFDGIFGFVLLRKIWRYRETYRTVHAEIDRETDPELTEFEE
ncbi:PrsW family intramembrane metalloprotease [Halopenitus persicus]|uniref:Membrane proteinase PrsW, cleaves anti-sigma factor RsiW, M82 family n=1 Tax=Halopenitus persicus TaxID=1048396 RepID=A0A1H3FE61_9EURY|nr:PrsW family intramembrane metalloprotease [Halopenitus persicus]SDX89373.1 Membrane proteinase PrsW, cleaves anti-sigma factor RsiW, M82 family [Halopenitus persicus]